MTIRVIIPVSVIIIIMTSDICYSFMCTVSTTTICSFLIQQVMSANNLTVSCQVLTVTVAL